MITPAVVEKLRRDVDRILCRHGGDLSWCLVTANVPFTTSTVNLTRFETGHADAVRQQDKAEITLECLSFFTLDADLVVMRCGPAHPADAQMAMPPEAGRVAAGSPGFHDEPLPFTDVQGLSTYEH